MSKTNLLFLEKNKEKIVLLTFPSFPRENAILSEAHNNPKQTEDCGWPNKIYSTKRLGLILVPSSYFTEFQ